MFRRVLMVSIILAPRIGFSQSILRINEPTPSLAQPGKPKKCRPEGKHSVNVDHCCSKASSGGICCGVTGGSCAISGCCDPAGSTPYCHQGTCVACLPDGAGGTPDSCCSETTAGGICCGETGGSCAVSGCCAVGPTQHCHQGRCVACLPEGASGTPDSCCSETTSSGICCGETGGSCAVSGCCAVGPTPYCHQGSCVECLPEGASTESGQCCSGAGSEDGICCGEVGGSCATSGCCADDARCEEGTCIDCLPEGANAAEGPCCSGDSIDGVCCGQPGGSCAISGCCGGGEICHDGTCGQCLPEGSQEAAEFCCSETAVGEICCGEAGGSCAVSGCCGVGNCCNGTCHELCPPKEIRNPGTCQCEPCIALGSPCAQADQCCSGACCNGVCKDTFNDKFNCGACGNRCEIPRFSGLEMCQNGICGMLCTGTSNCNTPAPPIPDSFCPQGSLCAGFCSVDVRSYICCEPCSTSPLFCLASNCGGVCCCGACVNRFGELVCDHSRPPTCVP